MTSEPAQSQAGMELLAACVEANVRSLAHTTDALIASEQHRARDLAEALVLLYDSIDRLPDAVRTMAQEKALWRASVAYDTAQRLLSDGT